MNEKILSAIFGLTLCAATAFGQAQGSGGLSGSDKGATVDGASLTNLNASNITSGTLANARLNSSVTLLGNLIELATESDLNGSMITNISPVNVTGGVVTTNQNASVVFNDGAMLTVSTNLVVGRALLVTNIQTSAGANAILVNSRQLRESGGNRVLDWEGGGLYGGGILRLDWPSNLLVGNWRVSGSGQFVASNLFVQNAATVSNGLNVVNGNVVLLGLTYPTTGGTSNQVFTTDGLGNLTLKSVNLTNSVGNLAVAQLNSGTAADGTTFWRGDGTWAVPASGGGGDIFAASNNTFTAVNTFNGVATNNADLTVSNLFTRGNVSLGQGLYQTNSPTGLFTNQFGVYGGFGPVEYKYARTYYAGDSSSGSYGIYFGSGLGSRFPDAISAIHFIGFNSANQELYFGNTFTDPTLRVLSGKSAFSGNLNVGTNSTTVNGARLYVNGATVLGKTGTTISNHWSYTAVLDFASIGAGATSNLLISVPGAKMGDAVVPGLPVTVHDDVEYRMISTNDNVIVRAINRNLLVPAATTADSFRATVIGY